PLLRTHFSFQRRYGRGRIACARFLAAFHPKAPVRARPTRDSVRVPGSGITAPAGPSPPTGPVPPPPPDTPTVVGAKEEASVSMISQIVVNGADGRFISSKLIESPVPAERAAKKGATPVMGGGVKVTLVIKPARPSALNSIMTGTAEPAVKVNWYSKDNPP